MAPYFLTAANALARAEMGRDSIINLSSWIDRLGIPSSLYSSIEGAMEALTKAWAAEIGPAGVRVNPSLRVSSSTSIPMTLAAASTPPSV